MSVEVDDVWLYEMILGHLRTMEETYPALSRESPHFASGERRAVVLWLGRLARAFKVGLEAHHLAVFLFDYFLADHQADPRGLYLIGAAAFSVACKVNDVEINVPQASKILKLAPFENVMQSSLLKSTEILILQHFNWNVHKPTEASFLEYYSASCLAIELELVEDLDYANKVAKYFNKWVTYFREKVLLDDSFRDFLPSKVACAIVISSRISMSLSPEWPEFMVHLTGWQMSDLEGVVKTLRNGLKYDLLMERNQKLQFYESLDFCKDVNKLKKNNVNSRSLADLDINSSSVAQAEDTYIHLSSSIEPYSSSLSIQSNHSIYENSPNYFASNTFHDSSETTQFNSNIFLNPHFVSMNIINNPNIYISNAVMPDQQLMLALSNDQNQIYYSTEDSCEKSIDSHISNACDSSINSSNDSFVNCHNDPLRINCHQPIIKNSFDQQEQSKEQFDMSFDYLSPISESLTSSSSMYLIVSQMDINANKQYHSKHSHSVVLNPNNIPPRRSQNKDSIIANSMNNGYYALKKRAPGLVINVNGAGSSYSFNCLNNTKSTNR